MFSEETYRKILRYTVCLLPIVLGVYLFFRYLLGAVVPFLLAYAIAFCLQPLVRAMEKRAGISRKVTVLLAVCIILAALLFLCVLIFRRISGELSTLAGSLGEFLTRLQEDHVFKEDIASRICDLLPFPDAHGKVEEFLSDLDGHLLEWLGALAEKLSGSVLPFLASLASFLPSAFLSVLVVLIAAYYFAIDFRGCNRAILSVFPAPVRENLRKTKQTLTETGGNFLRAYGLLWVITFSELFAAMLILGYRYAFLIALFTSLIDILPVLGTGTVLVPWAAFCFLTGNTQGGIGLLIVYAVITVVRQVLEPKIVGKYIGLPPLLSLAAMYIGLQLFGFWGLFLFPLAATVGYRFFSARKSDPDPD